MKITGKWLLLALIIVGLAAGSCYAGAWTADKGVVYHKLSGNAYSADKAFNNSGSRQSFPDHGEFSDTNITYYMEYGVLDNLTILASVAAKQLKSEDDLQIARTRGFSDLDLGLKYRFLSGDFGVMSIQGLIKVPEFYDDTDAVPMGNGQYDTELRILYGRSLYPFIPGYFNIEAGYRFRAQEPADEFRYLVELGMDITPIIYTRVKLDGITGMDNADLQVGPTGNPTTTLDYDLGKLDLALGFKLSKPFSLELGYRKDIYGKNTAAGENFSLSMIVSY